MEPLIAQGQRDAVSTPAPDEIRITRVFNAPRQLVWNAWTEPAMLVHWFGCAAFSTVDAKADVREGGQYRVVLRNPEGEDMPIYGTYMALRPTGHLAFTHLWEKPPVPENPAHHKTIVTVDLYEDGERTRMEFRQTGLASIASRDSHVGGWSDSCDALQRLLQQ